MLGSVMRLPKIRLPRLVPPMLSGIFFLSLSGAPSPAQAPGAPAPRAAPGQVVEAIAPAATVVSTVHYQAHLGLTCSLRACSGELPRLGARRRLNLTRMSCYLQGTTGAPFFTGFVELRSADDSFVLVQWLPVDHSGSDGFSVYHQLNRAVDVQVGPRQHIEVRLSLGSGTALSASCAAAGTLDTLQ